MVCDPFFLSDSYVAYTLNKGGTLVKNKNRTFFVDNGMELEQGVDS